MGEWMTQVPVKLSPETVARLDLLRAAYPFKPGRSTVIRELVEEGLRLIAEGIMQFRATTSNRVPSVQSVPGIPNAIPADLRAPELAGPKPPMRISAPQVGARRRAISHVSRMVSMATVPSGITFFPKHLQLNSTRIVGRAA